MIAELLGLDLIIVVFIFAIFLAGIGLVIWALVDIYKHSAEAFYAVESSKIAWALILIILTFAGGFSPLLAIVYLVRTRKKLRAVEASGVPLLPLKGL